MRGTYQTRGGLAMGKKLRQQISVLTMLLQTSHHPTNLALLQAPDGASEATYQLP